MPIGRNGSTGEMRERQQPRGSDQRATTVRFGKTSWADEHPNAERSLSPPTRRGGTPARLSDSEPDWTRVADVPLSQDDTDGEYYDITSGDEAPPAGLGGAGGRSSSSLGARHHHRPARTPVDSARASQRRRRRRHRQTGSRASSSGRQSTQSRPGTRAKPARCVSLLRRDRSRQEGGDGIVDIAVWLQTAVEKRSREFIYAQPVQSRDCAETFNPYAPAPRRPHPPPAPAAQSLPLSAMGAGRAAPPHCGRHRAAAGWHPAC